MSNVLAQLAALKAHRHELNPAQYLEEISRLGRLLAPSAALLELHSNVRASFAAKVYAAAAARGKAFYHLEPYEEGRRSITELNQSLVVNPYPAGSADADAWEDGRDHATVEEGEAYADSQDPSMRDCYE